MSDAIRNFYDQYKLPKPVVEQNVIKFEKHEDIAREFEYWLQTGEFMTEGVVTIEGYTAQKLAETSEYLKGDGAFVMLIELRENPQRALKRIAEGFKRK